MSEKTVEGKENVVEEIQPDKDGKYPETVPWNKYVGIKESLGTKLESERAKVASLEEKLKTVPNQEEFDKIKQELEEVKGKYTQTTEELKTIKESSISEKRNTLKTKGVPEDSLKDKTEKELDAMLLVLGTVTPKPDLGGGGGSSSLPIMVGIEMATKAYEQSKK